jgi:hypothetical protein
MLLQTARGLADTYLSNEAVCGLERAKWRLWHGQIPSDRPQDHLSGELPPFEGPVLAGVELIHKVCPDSVSRGKHPHSGSSLVAERRDL